MAKEVKPKIFELDLTEKAKKKVQKFFGKDVPVVMGGVKVKAYLATPWTLTRTDENKVHTFSYNPLVLPSVTYEQVMTEHRLLSGDIKYDKSTKKVKVLHVVWGEHNPMFRAEREVLEPWLDLNCKMILKWYDHDGHTHNDKGYLIADPSRPVYQVGYTFGFTLKLTEEA